MRDQLLRLADRTLRELVIPGSHDAAMYGDGFFESLGETQDENFDGQLTGGIRYFDVRPLFVPSLIPGTRLPDPDGDGVINLHHGVIVGPELQEVLDDVRRFMSEEGRQELVVLKFSHYGSFT